MDQHYTPPAIARMLVDASNAENPKNIADFSMGDGSLLKAAVRRWPGATLIGCDIDKNASARVRRKGFVQRVHTTDFLFSKSAILEQYQKQCDIVVLNPPFSSVGGARVSLKTEGNEISGGRALVFVAKALEFLSSNGELLAIVPSSCFESQRDEALLDQLGEKFVIRKFGNLESNVFENCSVKTTFIKVRPRKGKRRQKALKLTQPVAAKNFQAEVLRGRLPVHQAQFVRTGVQFVHTTDLIGGDVIPNRLVAATHSNAISGLAILLPRVGKPNINKICLIKGGRFILSDCVFAVRTKTEANTEQLFRLMKSNWSKLSLAYGGSCAPYLTLRSLAGFLQGLGVFSMPWAIEQASSSDLFSHNVSKVSFRQM